jgi:hypothetical protein
MRERKKKKKKKKEIAEERWAAEKRDRAREERER